MDVRVGWSEFDTLAEPFDVRVGWAELDAQGVPFNVFVGWCEFDCLSPNDNPIPPYRQGGGVTRYSDNSKRKYDIPVDDVLVDEAEEELVVLQILMEIAAYVLV